MLIAYSTYRSKKGCRRFQFKAAKARVAIRDRSEGISHDGAADVPDASRTRLHRVAAEIRSSTAAVGHRGRGIFWQCLTVAPVFPRETAIWSLDEMRLRQAGFAVGGWTSKRPLLRP